MSFDEGSEHFDFRNDEDNDSMPDHVSDVVEHLRDTLTHDMARRIIPNRFGIEIESDEQLEGLMEELISDAYNDGYDDWDDFPY